MTAFRDKTTIFFDLDNTLFDHYYSMRKSLETVRSDSTFEHLLGRLELDDLVSIYSNSLEDAHSAFISGRIPHHRMGHFKLNLFFCRLGANKSSTNMFNDFQESYSKVYLSNRRATPGSVECLVRLQERGYVISIITNGKTDEQAEKVNAIGIAQYLHYLCVSDEVGAAKPDSRIYRHALNKVGKTYKESVMVGDSKEADIEGSIAVGITPVLYAPKTQNNMTMINGKPVVTISKMKDLLAYFEITERMFRPTVKVVDNSLIIQNLGIDIITAPRHCLRISQAAITKIIMRIEKVLDCIIEGFPTKSLQHIREMMLDTAECSNLIDQTKIKFSISNCDMSTGLEISEHSAINLQIESNPNSICLSYPVMKFESTMIKEYGIKWLKEFVLLFDRYCEELRNDHPRAALRCLRQAALHISYKFPETGLSERDISGEEIDFKAVPTVNFP